MALQVIRANLANVAADAIVIPANPPAQVGGGTESSIYEAAGVDKLLAARQKIGELQPGDVAATEAFNLPAKILIHAVSAVWSGGDDETKILRDCYRKSLELARERDCRSIAFPLLGTGTNRVPKEKALLAATATIQKFLETNDMDVLLVIFGQRTFELAENYFNEITSFIDAHDEEKLLRREYRSRRESRFVLSKNFFAEYLDEDFFRETFKNRGQDFKTRFNELVTASKLSDTEIYSCANVAKKVFYDAKNFAKPVPTKRILFALILSLELPLHEALDLLARAGCLLSAKDPTDVIFVDCLREKIYDVDEVNDKLDARGLKPLGSKSRSDDAS